MGLDREQLETKLKNIREENKETIGAAIGAGEAFGGMIAGGFLQKKGWGAGGYSADKIGAVVVGGLGLFTRNSHALYLALGLAAPTMVGIGAKIADKGFAGLTAAAGVDGSGAAHQLPGAHTEAERGASIVHALHQFQPR